MKTMTLGMAAAMLTATLVTVAQAAPTPAARCDASKIKAAGKAVASRAKCDQKALAGASDPGCADVAENKLATAIAKVEAKGGCESSGDATELVMDAEACMVDFRAAIDGDDSCSGRKMKAVGAMTYAASKCWQKGYLAGGNADAACLAAAGLKLESAIVKADGAGTCTDTTPVLEALVDACVESLRTPAITSTTAEPTTTTEEPTTTTTSTTDTTTTTDTIPVPTMDWVFCAHAGETCVLPRHDQVVSLNGIPPATPWVTSVEGTSIECSPAALFPGNASAAGAPGDCYFLDVGCSYDTPPIGVIAGDIRETADFPSVFVLGNPPYAPECTSSTLCDLPEVMSADYDHDITIVAVDPRVCGPEDRAHLSYHWIIHPSFINNTLPDIYASEGVTGYFESNLHISDQSMPNLYIGAGYDWEWRVYTDITQEPHADFPLTTGPVTTRHRFFFRYADASANLGDAKDCQCLTTYPCEGCQFPRIQRPPAGTF